MLAAISRALEERDQMQGHGARVAALAAPLVEQLGWDAERTATLRFGAPLHDVGKVAVRPHVLGKPGALTLAELEEAALLAHAGDAAQQAGRAIREACLEAVASGARTPDLGGHLGTSEFTDEVIARVRSKLEVWAAL